MESLNKQFIYYLKKNGFINDQEFQMLNVEFTNQTKNKLILSLIHRLTEILKEKITEKQKHESRLRVIIDFINIFYKRFLISDDTIISKLFRRLFIIHNNFKKRNLLYYHNTWLFKILKLRPHKYIEKEKNIDSSHIKSNVNKLYEESKFRKIRAEDNKLRQKSIESNKYTFSPQINNKYIKTSFNNLPSEPCFMKLYNNQIEKQIRLKNLVKEVEEDRLIACSFQPKVNKSTVVKKDFFERIEEYKNVKEKRFNKIKDEYLGSPNKSFKSNSKSRIYSPNDKPINYKLKKEINIKKIEEKIMTQQGITFKPKINNCSQNLENNLSVYKRNKDFVIQKDIKLKNYITSEDVECTFTPKINNHPCLNRNLSENNPDCGERLFNYSNIYKKKKDEIIEEKERLREEFPFKPEINSKSRELLKKKEKEIHIIEKIYGTESIKLTPNIHSSFVLKKSTKETNLKKNIYIENPNDTKNSDRISIDKISKNNTTISNFTTPKSSGNCRTHIVKIEETINDIR